MAEMRDNKSDGCFLIRGESIYGRYAGEYSK